MHPCIHLTFIFYDQKFSNSLDLVFLWSFDEFSNLYLRLLPFKPISHLTMVCYHQNPIGRTLRLTISLFFMMTNLGYLGEEEISPSNQWWINQFKIYEFKTKIIKTCEFSIGNNVNHENRISYIYSKVKCTRNINIWKTYEKSMTMICI